MFCILLKSTWYRTYVWNLVPDIILTECRFDPEGLLEIYVILPANSDEKLTFLPKKLIQPTLATGQDCVRQGVLAAAAAV